MKIRSYFILITLLLVSITAHVNAAGSHIPGSSTDSTEVKPAPAFSLKDLDGKTVSLADYKGKILILDFWATWCSPCKAAFPYIQMVMNRYRNNPDVNFLFIDTREKTENYEETIKKFLEENKYTFHVILDEKGADGKQDVTFKKYGLMGIPTQYVIDRNGNIRYENIGYHPGKTDEQAANELFEKIESARQEKAK